MLEAGHMTGVQQIRICDSHIPIQASESGDDLTIHKHQDPLQNTPVSVPGVDSPVTQINTKSLKRDTYEGRDTLATIIEFTKKAQIKTIAKLALDISEVQLKFKEISKSVKVMSSEYESHMRAFQELEASARTLLQLKRAPVVSNNSDDY